MYTIHIPTCKNTNTLAHFRKDTASNKCTQWIVKEKCNLVRPFNRPFIKVEDDCVGVFKRFEKNVGGFISGFIG